MTEVDKGYAWVICFASFLMQFIVYGQMRVFGLLYVAFLNIFESSALETALLSAFFNASRSFLSKPCIVTLSPITLNTVNF